MDRETLQHYVDQGMSIRQICSKIDKGYSSVKYWLNKHGIETAWKKHFRKGDAPCVLCGKVELGRGGRRCSTCEVKMRRVRTKLAAVKLLGGVCTHCGKAADRSNFILFDFHHVDGKSFSISRSAHLPWKVIREEVLKCELLCCECHRMQHSGDEALVEEALTYKGRTQEVFDLLSEY